MESACIRGFTWLICSSADKTGFSWETHLAFHRLASNFAVKTFTERDMLYLCRAAFVPTQELVAACTDNGAANLTKRLPARGFVRTLAERQLACRAQGGKRYPLRIPQSVREPGALGCKEDGEEDAFVCLLRASFPQPTQ